MLFWAVAILSHYDGLFIAPFAIYLLGRWYSSQTKLPLQARRLHLAVPAALAVTALGLFFIPFIFDLGEDTLQYWQLRLAGEEAAGVPSSMFTFRLYNPLLSTYFYAFFGLLSLFRLRKTLPVWLWFLFPWVVLEVVFTDPGTHIYTYIMPACILVASGIEILTDIARRLLGNRAGTALAVGVATLAVAFLALVSHLIFIDHTPEYPWEERRILSWTVGAPGDEYRAWVFGFPYNRQWEAIGEFVNAGENTRYYATNEKKIIAEYYIPYTFDIDQAGYYIHIYHPQRFLERLPNNKVRYWMKNHQPVETFEYQGRTIAEIYLMPPGTVGEIRSQGY